MRFHDICIYGPVEASRRMLTRRLLLGFLAEVLMLLRLLPAQDVQGLHLL
jgi:hypothetical protein